MNKFWKATGKAAAWFGVYYGVQMIVSFVVVFAIMFGFVAEYGSYAMDSEILMDEMMAIVLRLSNLITVLCNGLVLLCVVLFFRIRKKKLREGLQEELHLRPCSKTSLLMSVLYGFGICFVTGFLVSLIPFSETTQANFDESYALLDQGNPVIAFISVVFFAPVAEEVVFRGLIHVNLRKGMPVWLSMVLSSLLFGLLHGELIWILHAFLAGLLLAWIYELTHSLWPCILVHFTNNLISQVLGYFGETPVWLDLVLLGLSVPALVAAVIYLFRHRQPEPPEDRRLAAPVALPCIGSPAALPAGRKTVLLLGDSLMLDYAPVVEQLLADGMDVVWPKESCRYTQYTYTNLEQWQGLCPDPMQVGMVYWNNGQWDAARWGCDPEPLNNPAIYARMLVRIAFRLRELFPNAKIVFATTTPMNPDAGFAAQRATAEITAYNRAAIGALRPYGIWVDDLFDWMIRYPPAVFRDHCHLTEEGNAMLSNRVADFIRWYLR